MTKKLAGILWMAYFLLIGTAFALADLPRKADRPSVAPLIGWHEPPACFRRGRDDEQECLYYMNEIAKEHLIDKRYVQAAARFSQILTMIEHAEVLTNRGVAYTHLLRYKEARKDFTQATHLAPHKDEPWANLAGAELLLRRLPQALSNVSRALAIKPNDPEYLLLRAEILVALGKHTLAAADIRAAIDATRALPGGTLHSPEASERSADVQ